jgi:diphosphomevalonate decarboxylase
MHKIITYRCPSNIALVKYWGKKNTGTQIPANASISWSLSELYATTRMEFQTRKGDSPGVAFFLDGQPKPSFEPKIKDFLHRIQQFVPFLADTDLRIESSNNFPHGAGIASSAAGFGALSLAIVRAEGSFAPDSPEFLQKASFLARLGSGSACRSVYGAPAIWGETPAWSESSDLHAVPFTDTVQEDLAHWSDAVLIVDPGEKSVSSTQGHALLSEHAYAPARYQQAQKNLSELLPVMRNGDVERFIALVESEALQLHALMMASIPYYMLIRPNTLAIIQEIWQYRAETKLPICFTLDAGANVHLLYDNRYTEQVKTFIEERLLSYCHQGLYLCSATGGNPTELTS